MDEQILREAEEAQPDKTLVWTDNVTINYFDKKHLYHYVEGGYPVPGVTSLLQIINKPALMPWAARMASYYVRDHYQEGMSGSEMAALCDEASKAYRSTTSDAADVGSVVHKYAEQFMQAMHDGRAAPQLDTEALPERSLEAALNGIEALKEWYGSHKIEPIALERMVFSKEYFFAGTCDFFGRIDGKLVVADFKTSSGLYPEMLLQVGGAYVIALTEEFQAKGNPIHLDEFVIIMLDKKTGRFKVYEIPCSELYKDAFLYAASLNKMMKKIGDDVNAIR